MICEDILYKYLLTLSLQVLVNLFMEKLKMNIILLFLNNKNMYLQEGSGLW